MGLKVLFDDITKLTVDAIVNSTNHHMIGWSGVDRLIHEKGGPEFEAECRALDSVNVPGGAVYTNAYNMDCRYIIHTQAPTWSQGIHGEAAILAGCYKKSLHLATELGCESVAFPLLSAGNRMYPVADALDIAVTTIKEYNDLYDDLDVYLVLYGEVVESIAREKFGNLDDFVKAEYKPGMTLSEAERSNAVDALLKMKHKNFPDLLIRHMEERNIVKNSVLWNKAGISKQVFSNVLSGKAKPSLKTAVALAMALELDWDDTVEFLASAGLALGSNSQFDVIVKYFIKNRNYNISQLDVQLARYKLGTFLGEE